MARTKLGMQRLKNERRAAKCLETRRLKVKEMAVANGAWKKFCDVVHQTTILWRDGWIDVIDGLQLEVGNYMSGQAGHYISRLCLATRYHPDNCWAMSSGHNWATSPEAQMLVHDRTIRLYRKALVKRIGIERVDALEALEFTKTKFFNWQRMAKKLYEEGIKVNEGAIKERLKHNFKTIREQHDLKLILAAIV